MNEWPKRCGCGRQYSAADWDELPVVGDQHVDDICLEMRNCHCGSTLAILVNRMTPEAA